MHSISSIPPSFLYAGSPGVFISNSRVRGTFLYKIIDDIRPILENIQYLSACNPLFQESIASLVKKYDKHQSHFLDAMRAWSLQQDDPKYIQYVTTLENEGFRFFSCVSGYKPTHAHMCDYFLHPAVVENPTSTSGTRFNFSLLPDKYRDRAIAFIIRHYGYRIEHKSHYVAAKMAYEQGPMPVIFRDIKTYLLNHPNSIESIRDWVLNTSTRNLTTAYIVKWWHPDLLDIANTLGISTKERQQFLRDDAYLFYDLAQQYPDVVLQRLLQLSALASISDKVISLERISYFSKGLFEHASVEQRKLSSLMYHFIAQYKKNDMHLVDHALFNRAESIVDPLPSHLKPLFSLFDANVIINMFHEHGWRVWNDANFMHSFPAEALEVDL